MREQNLGNQNNENNFGNKIDPTPRKKDGVVGPLVGSVLIIVLIILAGLYFWGYVVENRSANKQNEESTHSETSDQDFQEIESEINSEDFESTEAELNQIEAEIEAELNN